MTAPTKEERARLRDKERVASPGPWWAESDIVARCDTDGIVAYGKNDGEAHSKYANAALIAAARNALVPLLDALDAAEAERERQKILRFADGMEAVGRLHAMSGVDISINDVLPIVEERDALKAKLDMAEAERDALRAERDALKAERDEYKALAGERMIGANEVAMVVPRAVAQRLLADSTERDALKAVLEGALPYVEIDADRLNPNHFCGPESECDGDCVAFAYACEQLRKMRAALKGQP